MIPDMAAGYVAIYANARGPNYATVSACSSSNHAIGEGLNIIRRCDAEIMIVGGAEAGIGEIPVAAFAAMRALSTKRNDQPEKASRPFDADRDGFVMGEGAALLVLEDADAAARRGVTPYAELLGYGATSDAYHMVQPRADGREAARAATIALDDAGVGAGEIDYVSAHASSTPIGDLAEARALTIALGERAATVPVSGTKALYGHPLGASGAIEAAICALAIRDGWAPASVNLVAPEPELDGLLPGLLHEGRPGTYRRVLSTSFGFGGLNAALVLGSAD
jgi:3-oxoacyl-[acyl-carrier-protein] synthase II